MLSKCIEYGERSGRASGMNASGARLFRHPPCTGEEEEEKEGCGIPLTMINARRASLPRRASLETGYNAASPLLC